MSGPRLIREPDRLAEDGVGTLPGVTPKRVSAFARLGVVTIEDLLRLAPRRWEDRRAPRPIASLEVGDEAFVIGRVTRSFSQGGRGGMSVLTTDIEDGEGTPLRCRWFHRGFTPRSHKVGSRLALFGAPKAAPPDPGGLALHSPSVERLADDPTQDRELPGAYRWVPVYPTTTGLSTRLVRETIWRALERTVPIVDPLPGEVVDTADVPALASCLAQLHFPSTLAEAEGSRQRLAFDELFVHELLVARRRIERRAEQAVAVPFPQRVIERIEERLPFTLTPGQQEAVTGILEDMRGRRPMNRLLQGDVGSGKTAVAVYALLGAIAAGLQVAFMAPTEVLARQHLETLEGMLEGSRVRMALLTGGRKTKVRAAIEADIRDHELDLVVGTHAVISKGVSFARLGLVIVDEQHKFGVRQRRHLLSKGEDGSDLLPHCLVMTATPIPRSLALTLYGDLDVSVIRGRPPGRVPVKTIAVKPREGRAVMQQVREALDQGRQAYVIYPLVEGSDKVALRDATEGRDKWAKALPGVRVDLLHGRMKAAEKAEVMDAFRRGDAAVLVSTVVIEVGVDVPNASVLVVEHAERFGLSQLHQLRGRIGRGGGGGLCVLIDRSTKGRPARLDVLVDTEDGFEIAEQDLQLRGVGDLFGTRQHGRPAFRAASLPRDLPLLEKARGAATRFLAERGERAFEGLERMILRIAPSPEALEAPGKGG